MTQFSHLHCHTQYSVLDGAANIAEMVAKAKADGMPAVAITDHGNMFGVFEFVNECNKQGVKAIVGCEFYMVEDMSITSFAGTGKKDKRYHQLLLAKNAEGYKNIATLCSLGYKEGLYGKYPRIDLELLKKYKNGLIATSCCIGARIPQTILASGEDEGEKEMKKWWDLFGEDFYLELQRHNIQNINNTGLSQEDLNQILLKWSHRYNIPAICTNDSHYVEQDDAEMHDILLCVNTGEKKSTPIKSDGDEDGMNKEYRFGFPNDQFFFKTTQEMGTLFADVPYTLENTQQIVDKVEKINLVKDIMMPNFTIPDNFKDQQDLMRHLVYDGAKRKYGDIIPAHAIERIELELSTIFTSKFEGYFLVIEDFLREARKMNVWVGPGRGSAAGSVVAYCLDITQVDPLQYGLLFERFLNPERVSFPDIDIDFEDEGRQSVLDYVVAKYGKNNVSQIITFGTMKEKSAIRDVGRVLDVPLFEVNKIAKTVPDSIALKDLLNEEVYKSKKNGMKPDEVAKAEGLKLMYKEDETAKKIIDYAIKLKGSVRNTGVHACGVIIAPENLETLIPVSTAKDSSMLVTQFDNRFVEKAGLLKMDFLGLKTLNILKSIVEIIRLRHGIVLDLATLPLDDELTFEVFKKGQTDGIFQFESPGMKKSLIGLQPDRFTDLIAMNALYRPGPLDYIPNYIDRKHGREKVTYDIEDSKEILEETYGIMVYQEQVMQLSQKLANFTKGQADSLRKAMGKKVKEEMDKLYTIYIDGCKANGHPEDKANKIWQDMEKFAQYAFNKSHSTCYALVAYHCAYLKAHYPSEFMAGLVSNNMDNIDEVGKYMQEAKKMGIDVLGPDINESSYRFTVNKKGQIRFGLSALKGVGENLVKEMEENRALKGEFADIYDFVSRLGSTVINKRALEPLAMGGAFDCFADLEREQYYEIVSDKEGSFIERLIKFSNSVNSSQTSGGNLFGDTFVDMVDKPLPPKLGEFNVLERLEKEKEVLGMYLSGHPLDPYRKIIEDCSFQNFDKFGISSGTVLMAGMVSGVNIAIDKQGKRYGRFSLSNFNSKIDLRLKGENLLKYENFLKNGMYMIVKIKKDEFTPKDGGSKIEFDKIIEIYLLENAWEKARRVDILIDAKMLTANKIFDLKTFFLEHKGKTTIYFNITDGVQVSDKNIAPKEGNSEMLDEEGNVIEDFSDKEEDLELEIQEDSEVKENPLMEALTFLSRNVLLDVSAESISKLEAIVGKENVKLTISMD